MKKQAAINALESAINSYTTDTPGTWSVNAGDCYVQLVWECESNDPEISNLSDEPWRVWGGDEIAASAGMPDFNDSGADRYTDRYGDDIACQWCQWNFPEAL